MHKNPFDDNDINISNWVHKRLTHNNYLKQKLYGRDKFNQVYEIDLELEQGNDDSSSESTAAEHSYFTVKKPMIWSYIDQNGVRTSYVIEQEQDCLEAYFRDLDDHMGYTSTHTVKAPLITDVDKWNGFSTNCTYSQRCITTDWVEWSKMASSGRYDAPNINDLVHRKKILSGLYSIIYSTR